MHRSYWRRRGDFAYDIEIYEATPPADAGRFYAQVVNMVRLESGQTVSVNAELQDAYGATRDDAFSKIEVAVEEWVEDQTRPDWGARTMSRLSLGDIDELDRLRRKILNGSALIDQLLGRETFRGTSDETLDSTVGGVTMQDALVELLDDLTDAARRMAAIVNRDDEADATWG
jgi:hypothetical protein